MNTSDSSKACPKCGATVPPEAPQGLCPQCVLGAAAAPESAPTATAHIPSLERLAVAFPQLQVLELIGRGGMGFVFKARQPHLDRFVALKLLPDSLAHDPHFAERFNREGRTLARLNHPNIVSIFDFGQAGGFYFLLMEYVDGVNLRQAMQAGRFSPAEALTIVPKICAALQYAHEEGVLHRDIKPENILLDTKGRVKIADFGIAKIVGEEKSDVSLTATGAALGTPHYMAPEQFEKPATVDHRADIYSLGVVFYEMLTGELPIGRFSPPSQRTPVDPRVDDVVMRTLEKEREKRFQSAGEMKTNVEHLTEAGAGSFKRTPPRASSPESAAGGTIAVNPKDVLPDVPAWSYKAIAGAALVAVSLVGPLFLAVRMFITRGLMGGGEMILGLGSVSLLGISGTILGWMALSEVSAEGRRLRGGVFAVFAALAWPALLLGAITIWLVVAPVRNFGATVPFAAFLLMLVPAGIVTFMIWGVFATVRKATGQPDPQRRGVLKWVFLGLMLSALGFVLLPRGERTAPKRFSSGPPESKASSTTDTTPWIRFTFTAVELREVKGVRWLAIDYLDDVHGECQKAFPWETTIPGFKAETRATEFVTDGKDSSPPVRHQRVEYRMPDSIRRDQLERLRDHVARTLNQKTFRLELGEEKLLFELVPIEGGLIFIAAAGEPGDADAAAGFGGSLKARLKVMSAVPQVAPGLPQNAWGQAQSSVDRVRQQNEEAARKRADSRAVAQAGQNEAKEIHIRLAGEELDAARKKNEAGLLSQFDLAEAERRFAVAEARGDAVAAARTNLKFAQEALAVTQKRVEVGVLAPLDLKFAQSRLTLAEIDLKEALKTNPPAAEKVQAESASPNEDSANAHALQFRLVANDADTTTPVDMILESPGNGTSVPLRVLRPVLMDGSAVAQAGIVLETNGQRTIAVQLTTEGTRQLAAITTSNINRQLAIVAEGSLLSAPIIRGPISGGELHITGGWSAAQVHKLVATLNRTTATFSFSEPRERSLPVASEIPGAKVCLNLGSGNFVTNRSWDPLLRSTRDWMWTNGADLLAYGPAESASLLIGLDWVSIEAPNNAWDSLPPEDIVWNWTLTRKSQDGLSRIAFKPGLPDTFLFRTRGDLGLLQILSGTNAGSHVKIRYKLVKSSLAVPPKSAAKETYTEADRVALNGRLTEAESAYAMHSNMWSTLSELDDERRVAALSTLSNNSGLRALNAELDKAKLRLKNLKATSLPSERQALMALITTLEKQLQTAIQGGMIALKTQTEAAREMVEDLKAQVEKARLQNNGKPH